MTVGVLTFWHGNANYGMMLQCWALQQVLVRLGHHPFVIAYEKSVRKGLPRRLLEKAGLYEFALGLYNPKKNSTLRSIKRHNALRNFAQFRKENLSLSIYYSSLRQIQNDPPVADCYIVGSDQVWSMTLDDTDNTAFFLNFGPDRIKRISYAPSFGFSEYPNRLLDKLKTELNRFNAISCREQKGVEICNQLGYEAAKVVDPSMLLDRKNYEDLATKYSSLTDNPYVFIYSLNIKTSEEVRFSELEAYLVENSMDLVVTPADGYYHGLELFGDNTIYSYSTIGQWIANIMHSALVITPSFHGIVFAIIFEKPFVYTPLHGSHSNSNERIIGLLNDMGLTDRILFDDKKIEDIIHQPIDWTSVHSKLMKLREKSLNFLSKSLEEMN